MDKPRVIITSRLEQDLALSLTECAHDRLFILTDDNTARLCWPVISDFIGLRHASLITIPASDAHKDLTSLSHVWQELSRQGATRHSCLICLGGGMVTDLGGFAAATFKRGIPFINLPTTLLAMVDASVGGKTGINFLGLKNEIGVFRQAEFTLIHTPFLSTLDTPNLCSGYAEMLKHGLLSDDDTWAALLNFDLGAPDLDTLSRMVADSVAVKERIVMADPLERGIRKALNLGHTIGHAIESWQLSQGQPILHGYAVAYGLVAELYLSSVLCGFPTAKLHATARFIREVYGTPAIECKAYPTLLQLMRHDKKNIGETINFTLLSDIGQVLINQSATDTDIQDALDFLLF